MARSRRWITLGIGVVVALVVALFGVSAVVHRAFSPSGDVGDYASSFVDDRGAPGNGSVKVTFLGTATLLVDDGTTQLLFDAYLTAFPLSFTTPYSTDKPAVDAALTRAGAHDVEAIFISHTHTDHVFDLPYIAERTGAHVYGSASALNVGRGGDVPERRMTQVQPGMTVTYGGFTVTPMVSKHSPGTVGGDDVAITAPLRQPAIGRLYTEGGSWDYLVHHGTRTILVKASGNYLPGALDGVHADALFLGVAQLGKQDATFQNDFYDQTVGTVRPPLVVGLHWNDFTQPVTDHMAFPPKVVDRMSDGLDFMIRRTGDDHIRFALMQGFSSVLLFPGG